MMKVLYLVPGSESDPVSMVFAKRQIQDLSAYVDSSIYYIHNRLNPLSLLADYLKIIALCLRSRPHILHAQYGTVTSFLGCLIPGVAFIMSVRGSDLDPTFREGKRVKKSFSVFLTQFAAIRAQKILVVSEHLKRKLFHQDKAIVVPSGVDLAQFKKTEPSSAKRELGWDQQKCYILFNAGKEPLNKRLDLALEHYSQLKALHPNLEFMVLRGETPPAEVKKMLVASDLLFMTSEREGSPNIVKEALASGLPVVAYEVGDVSDVLKHDPASKCLKVGDVEGFLSHAHWVISQKPRGLADMRPYSSEHIAQKIYQIYQSVLA